MKSCQLCEAVCLRRICRLREPPTVLCATGGERRTNDIPALAVYRLAAVHDEVRWQQEGNLDATARTRVGFASL